MGDEGIGWGFCTTHDGCTVLLLRMHDGLHSAAAFHPPGDRLVPLTAIGAGGGLTAHVSRAKASSLVAAAGQQWPGLGHLAVRHTGCAFLLTAEPSFCRMQHLTALRCGRGRLHGAGAGCDDLPSACGVVCRLQCPLLHSLPCSPPCP